MALMRNAAFNFFGAAVPAVLAIGTIPYIVSALGVDDYGLLTLITSIIGYFALLDINVTASSTKYVAQYNSLGDTERLNETICFGLIVYVGIGLVGMIGLFSTSHYLVLHLFAIPESRQVEAVTCIKIAALGFAIGQVQSYLQSLLGAFMRFDISGRIEAIFGTLVPVATIGLLYNGFDLVSLIWLRVGSSLLQALVVWHLVRRLLPSLRWSTPRRETRNAMLSFSAYSFLSRFAALTYSNADKLIIGARVGISSLTFYVIPATLSNRVMSLVYRLSGVMFPYASSLAAQGRLDELKRDYLITSRYIFFVNGAVSLILAIFAQPILSLWLSPEFAGSGTLVMVLIALAQWIDSTTNIPSLTNDALGYPKVTGVFALVRAMLGLALIFVCVWLFGIQGAAIAHFSASLIMSTAFIIYVHNRTLPIALTEVLRQAYQPALMILIPVGLIGVLIMPFARLGWSSLVCCICIMSLLFFTGGIWKVCLPKHRKTIFAVIGLAQAVKKL